MNEDLDSQKTPNLSDLELDPVEIAVLQSFYPELVHSGRYAKERAVHLLSAATVLSAALIAAFGAAKIFDLSLIAKILAGVTATAWLITTAMFAFAASPPKPPPYSEHAQETSASQFVKFILDSSNNTQNFVERRLRRAIIASIGALFISVAALAVYTAYPGKLKQQGAVLMLSDVAAAALQCTDTSTPNATRITPTRFSEEFVTVTLACQDGDEFIMIPKDSINYVRIVN